MTVTEVGHNNSTSPSDEKVSYIEENRPSPPRYQEDSIDEKGFLRTSVRRRLNRSPAVPAHEQDEEEVHRHYSSKYQLEEEEHKRENAERYDLNHRNGYKIGKNHYIVQEDDRDYEHGIGRNNRRWNRASSYYHQGAGEGEEDDLSHGLQIYHDYLPELSRTPDLENAKPIIRMR